VRIAGYGDDVRLIAIAALAVAAAAYWHPAQRDSGGSPATSKVAFIEHPQRESASGWLSASMFFPLELGDVPQPDRSDAQAGACRLVMSEYNTGSYGSVRCSYYDKARDSTWNYFWGIGPHHLT
jgi:hypothetical protein